MWSSWNPNSKNSSAAASNPSFNTHDFLHASAQAGLGDFQIWLNGVTAYQNAPAPRATPPRPVVWECGSTRVLNYSAGHSDTIVIAIPSHINRATILDLLPGNSFMQSLAAHSNAWLVDWGAPAEAEKELALDEYIMQRLLPVIALARVHYKRVVLLGYCMGGLLALAAAQITKPDALVLLATPWDFYAYATPVRTGLATLAAGYAPWLQQGNALTVDMLQTLFACMQPTAVFEKFKRAGANGIDELFVAVEDWLNNGAAMPQRVAHTCLFEWFQENSTYRGAWRIAGVPIDPTQVQCPALIVLPEKDLIVPLAAAQPLVDLLPYAEPLPVPLGHIGMIVGRDAKAQVHDAVTDWICENFS